MHEQNSVAVSELADHVTYDQATGLFFWAMRGKGRALGAQAGSKMAHGYIAIGINGRQYTAHRLAWALVTGDWPKGVIDHINGNRSDNRISNLRDVTQSENMQNVFAPKSNNKTGFRGVSFHKQRRKYTARIKHNGKYLSLGLYTSPEDAHMAYIDAKTRLGHIAGQSG